MAFLSPLTAAASSIGRSSSTPEKSTSISDVLAQSLTTRSALDALCLGLSHKFVTEIAEAEDVFAKSVSKASGTLVSGLLAADFGSDASLRRSALIAVSKMATALSSELQAHAKLQSAAAATLASQAADAKAAAQRHSAARATRAREEQHAEEAHTRAQAKLREMNKALAEDQPRGPSIQASSSSTATDASTIPQPPQQDPWLLELGAEGCAKNLHTARTARAEDLGEEWRSLASIEAQHTESIQQALLACTNALTTPLVAVESEIDASG